MSRTWPARAAIILSLFMLVNGTAFAEKAPLKKRLEKFMAGVLAKGRDHKLGAGRAKFLELEPGTAIKSAHETDTADGVSRSCEVCLDKPKSKKVTGLILLAEIQPDPEHSETMNFKIAPDGSIQKVVKTYGTLKDGQPVKGSGRAEEVSIDAPGVRETLDRELAFWLDGKGRKEASPASGAKLVPVPAASRH